MSFVQAEGIVIVARFVCAALLVQATARRIGWTTDVFALATRAVVGGLIGGWYPLVTLSLAACYELAVLNDDYFHWVQ